MPKRLPTPQSPAAPRVPGTEPHLHSTTVGGNGGQETGFPLHLPDSLQCSNRRLPTSGPARQTTLRLSSPRSFAPFVIFPPLRRHGKGTASGIRNPGSNPGAIVKRTMISEHHFRTCDVEGTMLTPAWQGWLRIKRGGEIHREPNIMLGMQKHVIIVISFSSTISETNHRARTTVKWTPPLPPQGPACNQAKQHTHPGRKKCARPHVQHHKTWNNHPSAQQPRQEATAHTERSIQVLCPFAADEWVQGRKLRLRGAQLLIKVTQ